MRDKDTHGVPLYAATVGFFDGVHAGHRFLIEELKREAKKHGLLSMVVTFKLHPRKVLHDDYQPQLLCSPEEKLALIRSTGVDKVVELDFTLAMAQLSAYEFMHQVLSEHLKVALLLAGHDHRFGHNREDGFTEYVAYGRKTGIQVMLASRFATTEISRINSSEIRLALKNGEIAKANTILTVPYAITGYVVDGFKVGRKIGFPTANIQPVHPEKLIPGVGVYAVRVEWNKGFFKAMMNIGHRPTLENGSNISLEVHIIDFSEDIYQQEVRIQFIRKIREEKKFDNVDQIITQLKKDKTFVVNLNY